MTKPPTCRELDSRIKELEAKYAMLLKAVVRIVRVNRAMRNQADEFMAAAYAPGAAHVVQSDALLHPPRRPSRAPDDNRKVVGKYFLGACPYCLQRTGAPHFANCEIATGEIK